MFNTLLIKVLGLSRYALLVGVLLVGVAIYDKYKAEHGGGAPAQSELTTVVGEIADGREVTVERKRRRGGKTTTQYYELDVKPAGRADLLKLRVDHDVPKERLEASTASDKLTITYEPSDVNMVFGINDGKTNFISYDEVAKLLQARADREAQSSGGLIGVGVLLALLGAGGFFWRRRLAASQAEAAAAAA